MAGHKLIDTQLAALARQLPSDVVDELADGLTETWLRYRDAGLSPAEAAGRAITEFGTPEQITDAFVDQAPGRRAALVLLSTGPIAALCWGTTLVTSRAWTWPVPTAAALVLAGVLLLTVGVLVAAATSRHSYHRTRLGGVGGLAVIALDIAMITVALLVGPTPAWPVAAAVALSLTRIAITVRVLPRTLARYPR